MPLPKSFENRLSLPALAAPMFLVSGPSLIIETCRSGVAAAFPALNQRTTEGFEQWVVEIKETHEQFQGGCDSAMIRTYPAGGPGNRPLYPIKLYQFVQDQASKAFRHISGNRKSSS